MGCPADLPLSGEPDSFTSSWHLLGMALAVGRLALLVKLSRYLWSPSGP